MKKKHIKIALITLFVHVLYFFIFPSGQKINQLTSPPTPLRVVTKEITPPRAQVIKLPNESKKGEEKFQSFLPKTSPPKKIVKKKPTVKKKPVKNVKSVRGKLDKNVAKIKAKNAPVKKNVKKSTPEKPVTTSTQKGSTSEETHAYLQKISHSLQEWLTLPEKGSVKLTITVQANGKIVNMEVLTKESEKNWEYLRTVLPGIQLPTFKENKEITFTITFCDD